MWARSDTNSPDFASSSTTPHSTMSRITPTGDSSNSSRQQPHGRRSTTSTTDRGQQPTRTGERAERPRLTEQEKKNNHIASEQKRRAAIREGFDRLTELVPGLEGQGRSESIVLSKTVDFIRSKLREREELIAEIESYGGRVDDRYRTV